MQAATQEQKKAASAHIADSESIEASRTGPGTLFVVTDSRVLSIRDAEQDGRSVRSIQSTTLTDGVRGVEIQEFGPKTVDWIQAALGALALFVGVIAIMFAFGSSGAESIGGMLIGLVLMFAGGFLTYGSFDTPDGEIRVDIDTDAGTDTYWLPEDESDVAAAVSEVVAENSTGS